LRLKRRARARRPVDGRLHGMPGIGEHRLLQYRLGFTRAAIDGQPITGVPK
jgi:hypothetical protein